MTNSSISCESSNLRRELKKIPKSSLLIRFGLQRLISRFDVIFFFFRLVPWCLVTQVRDFGDNHLSPPLSHPHLDTVFCSRLLCPRPRTVWAGVRAVTRLSTEGIPHPPRVPLQIDRVKVLDGHRCVARRAKRSSPARREEQAGDERSI